MFDRVRRARFSLLSCLCLLLATPLLRGEGMVDVAAVERGLQSKTVVNDDEQTCKMTFPRTDVKVSVEGKVLPPFMGPSSWATFKAGGNGSMVMGEFVLLQDEIAPAMDAAFAAGLEVTGLHDHFLYEEPRVCFMHIGGEGDAEALGSAVRQVIEKVKTVRVVYPKVAKGFGGKPLPEKSTVTGKALSEIIGSSAVETDGMEKFAIGREVVMPCNCVAGKEMGVATSAAFYGSDADCFVDGEVVAFPGELQPVLKTLRKGGVRIVAISSHMEGEAPKAIFVHFNGRGPAANLAKTVRAVLDDQKAAAEKNHPAGKPHEHHAK